MAGKQRSQITMTEAEISSFVEKNRTATMATLSADGMPHLIAMWFAIVDGEIWFETKAKSQKAVNLRRDSRMSVLIEDGQTYDTLRGVSMEGTGGVIVEDPEASSLWESASGSDTRPVHRRSPPGRRRDAPQARRGTVRSRSNSFVGSPQARDACDASFRLYRTAAAALRFVSGKITSNRIRAGVVSPTGPTTRSEHMSDLDSNTPVRTRIPIGGNQTKVP